MSLEIYDINGFVADLGSASGYCDFADWAETKGPVLVKFIEDGTYDDLPELIKALTTAGKAPDEYVEETRQVVLAAAKKAKYFLTVSDGQGEIDLDPHPSSPARPRKRQKARRPSPKARKRSLPKARKRPRTR